MQGITIHFKNRPNEDGTLSNHTIRDCLIAQNGAPLPTRGSVIIHLPKNDDTSVVNAWFEYEGGTYHVTGSTVPGIDQNVPTKWNRYVIAQKIY